MYLRKFNHFIYVMLAVSLLASCKGLKQAEEFGKLHEKLETNFASLSNDIYLSCLRKASYPDEGYFPAIISFRSDEDKKCKEKFLPVYKKSK
ncbi:hypothetical protein AM1_E0017 (plasmid) [Acaryochloris marina MBIC11017]|uniref:Lipoprotein n=2 Tax=Acaryochloris marina TaxID=155978 RepID=A8ZP51_ACAM1|nr:hypothetical protein AM1_E0017 [Acaryochloris marina MBIC11017]